MTCTGPKDFARTSRIMTRQTRSVYCVPLVLRGLTLAGLRTPRIKDMQQQLRHKIEVGSTKTRKGTKEMNQEEILLLFNFSYNTSNIEG